MRVPALVSALLAALVAVPLAAQHPRLQVRVVADEADAALAIADLLAAGREPDSAHWARLFSSEGYRRLQRREASLGRSFTDSAFRAFVGSPDLARRSPRLRAALDGWRRIDATAAAERAFGYLPAEARIHARIYPVVKPQTNSFVFEPRTDPAIFLYLDPDVPPAKFENTLAHELHHIGVASVCPAAPEDGATPAPLRDALAWMGGFAEGRAMLAAAGSPDVHPHAVSDPAERAVWEAHLSRAGEDLRRMERFYLAVLDGSLPEEERTRQGFAFVTSEGVPQGPFYTLGWLMASTVERELGRERLVASLCDPAAFLRDYVEAAGAVARAGGPVLPAWSGELLRRLGGGRGGA